MPTGKKEGLDPTVLTHGPPSSTISKTYFLCVWMVDVLHAQSWNIPRNFIE